MRIVICDRCRRIITKTTYYRVEYRNGEIWDACGNCRSALEYSDQIIHEILSVEGRKE